MSKESKKEAIIQALSEMNDSNQRILEKLNTITEKLKKIEENMKSNCDDDCDGVCDESFYFSIPEDSNAFVKDVNFENTQDDEKESEHNEYKGKTIHIEEINTHSELKTMSIISGALATSVALVGIVAKVLKKR